MSAPAEPPSSGSDLADSLRSCGLRRVMCDAPIVVDGSVSTAAVVDLMRERCQSAAIVCGEVGVEGIFTERDHLLKVAGRPNELEQPISTHMTRRPQTIEVAATLGDCLPYFVDGGYRHLPVVDGGVCCGLLGAVDVVRFVGEHFPAEVLNLPPRLDQTIRSAEGG
jgi:CBS domain-containing protein